MDKTHTQSRHILVPTGALAVVFLVTLHASAGVLGGYLSPADPNGFITITATQQSAMSRSSSSRSSAASLPIVSQPTHVPPLLPHDATDDPSLFVPTGLPSTFWPGLGGTDGSASTNMEVLIPFFPEGESTMFSNDEEAMLSPPVEQIFTLSPGESYPSVETPITDPYAISTDQEKFIVNEPQSVPSAALAEIIEALRTISRTVLESNPILALNTEKIIERAQNVPADQDGAFAPEDITWLRHNVRELSIGFHGSASYEEVSTVQPERTYTREEIQGRVAQYVARLPAIIQYAAERGAQIPSIAESAYNQAQESLARGDLGSTLEALILVKNTVMRGIDAVPGLAADVRAYAAVLIAQPLPPSSPSQEVPTTQTPHLE